MTEITAPIIAITLVSSRYSSDRLHSGIFGNIVPAIRGDDQRRDADLA